MSNVHTKKLIIYHSFRKLLKIPPAEKHQRYSNYWAILGFISGVILIVLPVAMQQYTFVYLCILQQRKKDTSSILIF